MPGRSRTAAFMLVELLVVVAIIAGLDELTAVRLQKAAWGAVEGRDADPVAR